MNPRERRHIFTGDSKFKMVQRPGGHAKFGVNAGSQADSGATLQGYAITFGTLSDDRGGYKVRIMKGAGAARPMTFALFNHSYDYPLAVTDNNSLRILPPDDYGIPIEIDMPNVSFAKDIQELIACGVIKGMSFAALPDTVRSTETKENGQTVVNLESFEYDEVTITPIPAFLETSIMVAPTPQAGVTPAQIVSPGGSQLSQIAAADGTRLNSYRETRDRLERLRLALLKI